MSKGKISGDVACMYVCLTGYDSWVLNVLSVRKHKIWRDYILLYYLYVFIILKTLFHHVHRFTNGRVIYSIKVLFAVMCFSFLEGV